MTRRKSMCRASKSSRADNPIGIWAKDPRQHRTREMHENIRLLAAGEATAAHHHLPYQRKTAGQAGTVIPKECVASQPHFRIGSWETWIHMSTQSPTWESECTHCPHMPCPCGARILPTIPTNPAQESECPHSPTIPICST